MICWGEYDCSDIAEGLSVNVTSLVSNDMAFAAVKANGSVITWGTDWAGGAKRQEFGTYRDVSDKLASNVTKVFLVAKTMYQLAKGGLCVCGFEVFWGGRGLGVHRYLERRVR